MVKILVSLNSRGYFILFFKLLKILVTGSIENEYFPRLTYS
jgi:hypothetical protein